MISPLPKLLLILCLGAAPLASAQDLDAGVDAGVPEAPLDAGAPAPIPDIIYDSAFLGNELEFSDLDLASLLEVPVVSSTKTKQRGAATPAVVTVISGEEIRNHGYGSIAEALRNVPGLYDVYDLVTHNVGVRGVSGGARASGNVIKLMIDGLPVDFRPTTGNFFGEELIPLELVDRVEIIRGPASALYGANAFLGVVNVITRHGRELSGLRLVGQGRTVRNLPGGGGGLVLGGGEGDLELIAGVNAGYTDRSGLTPPASSPALREATSPLPGRGASRNDISRSRTGFARLSYGNADRGKVSALAAVQNLDSAAEFQDFGPLSHGSRVSLLNQNYRLSYDKNLSETLSFQISGHYFTGAPTELDKRDLARGDYVLLPRVRAEGGGAALEARYQASSWLSFTVGADYVMERHSLQTFDKKLTAEVRSPEGTVLREAGTIIPGEESGRVEYFKNAAGLAQAIITLDTAWTATAGVRLDSHNIYGVRPSARAAFVYAPPEKALSLKLLYGSSFKAPSAEQLYTYPGYVFDLQGVPTLRSQQAHTFEAAAVYGFGEVGEIAINAFLMHVIDRVEFVRRAIYFQAQNLDPEWILGGEVDTRLKLAKPLTLRVRAGVARTVARIKVRPVAGVVEVDNSLYPLLQLSGSLEHKLPWAGLVASAEINLVTDRGTSQSNALAFGKSYTVPAYVVGALALSLPARELWVGRETRMSLRLSNVLNQQIVEPGFGGVDIPAQGFTGLFTVVQSF
jgi:outer membrane receptor protein involved in Fe transport